MPRPVLSQLQDGDELGGTDAAHSLARLYSLTPQAIVRMNDVAFTSAGIDAWVMATGGKRLPFVASEPFDVGRRLGFAVFTKNSRILLPPGGPRRPAVATIALPSARKSRAGLWVLFGGALAAYLAGKGPRF
jgi:hypothetical protein